MGRLSELLYYNGDIIVESQLLLPLQVILQSLIAIGWIQIFLDQGRGGHGSDAKTIFRIIVIQK